MIKTVSFAPPRGSGSRAGAKAAAAKTLPVEALRPPTRAASGRTSKIAKAPAQTSLELLFDAPDEPVAAPVITPVESPVSKVRTAPRTEVKTAKVEPSAPVLPQVAVVSAVVTEVEAALATKAPTSVKIKEVKAKKSRVPKDLAAQYGEKVVSRAIAPPVEAETVKKRLSKVEREARRELIKPSEGLLERLARVNQIAARKPKAEPRGKGWKFVCGRCGTTSYFETPGGLCVCGTIAIKE